MKKLPQILSTKRYDQFKRFNSNREIDRRHLARLIESIKAKNLLYLFPIVVNKQKEIVDGQHRLAAAMELGVEIYYIVDNDVTKADIAMVNNNRKGWTAKDYIKFYREEGYEAYERLSKLLQNYAITVMGAVRLMKAGVTNYSMGGGHDSMDVKLGLITCEEYHTAKTVLEILKPFREKVKYGMRPDLALEVKRLLLKYKLNPETCKKTLIGGAHLFPAESFYQDPSAHRILKELLVPETHGHSADEVSKILTQRTKEA